MMPFAISSRKTAPLRVGAPGGGMGGVTKEKRREGETGTARQLRNITKRGDERLVADKGR